MQLKQTFGDENARVLGSIMFLDMSNSTELKEKHPETIWLGTLASLFDVVTECIETDQKGKIVKFLGDGVMVFFTLEDVTNAINVAIRIQEALDEGRRNRVFDFHCGIGIATGRMVRAETPAGIDFFGSVVDKAARLCSAGSPSAILVDGDTIDNARMLGISSRVGVALDRSGADYKGEKQLVTLKGFSRFVEYYEIHWARERFGVKSSVSTNAVLQNTNPVAESSEDVNRPARREVAWRHGIIDFWNHEKGFGFINGSDKNQYYVNINFTLARSGLENGQQVFFVPKAATRQNAKPSASCAITVGQKINGVVKFIHQTKHFGFLLVRDGFEDENELFVFAGDHAEDFTPGDHVSFTVATNKKGEPIAKDIEKVPGAELEMDKMPDARRVGVDDD